MANLRDGMSWLTATAESLPDILCMHYLGMGPGSSSLKGELALGQHMALHAP